MSLNRQMDEENMAHLHIEVLLSCLKSGFMKFVGTQIEQKKIPSKVSQIQKDKYGMHTLTCEYQLSQ